MTALFLTTSLELFGALYSFLRFWHDLAVSSKIQKFIVYATLQDLGQNPLQQALKKNTGVYSQRNYLNI